MKKFLVIDGNSIMNRAFYGISSNKMLSNRSGVYTNAIYGFLNIYWMFLEKINPDYVAVSFDLKAPTFRHELFEDYKANRKGMPDELFMQMPYIKKILTAMKVPIYEVEGFEADDVLGTIAKQNEENWIFTYILTGDKDSFQLISENTSIVIPITKFGSTEYTIYTPELLKEKFDINPNQVIEVKALMGDNSDNIPGIKGIGQKTAYSMISKYGNIENIYEKLDSLDITPKTKEKFIVGKESAFMSRDLATIERNIPNLEVNYDECILTVNLAQTNKKELYELFKELEFNKFINKFDFSDVITMPETTSLTTESISDLEKTILNVNDIIYLTQDNMEIFESILLEEKIAYYLNMSTYTSNKNNGVSEVMNISANDILALYTPNFDNIYVIKLDNDSAKDILKKFALSKSTKLGFNIKQDLLYIFNNVCDDVTNFNFDLMISYYLMDANKSNYPIDYIFQNLYTKDLFEYINNKAGISEEKSNLQLSIFDNPNLIIAENEDVEIQEGLLNKLEGELLNTYLKGLYYSYDIVVDKLQALNMTKLFNEIEMPLVETLAYMEHTGMYIDITTLHEFEKDLTQNISKLENEIFSIAGENFNINSTQQLGNILFNKLGLESFKKTKTGYSTNKETLESLSNTHEIIDKILEYRQLVKLKSTYVDGLKTKINNDGKIHTTFMQTVAATGRISSTEPNLQNIPVKTEIGKTIRKFFIAKGSNVIIDADYSQIELRVLADISDDKMMIQAFGNNEDIHKVTASQVFGVNVDEVTNDMRYHAKAVNFGIVYGISDFGLSKSIGTSRNVAGQYIKSYLEKYEGIKKFMEYIVNFAKDKGYVETLFNRRRYIPELSRSNKKIIQFGERIALNTPIQGSAADIIKLSMNKIYRELKSKNLKSKLIMQVHDELIIEADKDEIEIVKSIMKEIMENIVKLKVPLTIDLSVGKSWYDAK